MTKTILLNGESFPFRLTLGAMNKFDNKFKAEGITSLNMHAGAGQRIEHMAYLMFVGIEAGLRYEGEDVKRISLNWIYDNVEINDLKEFTEVLADESDEEKKT